MVDKETNEETKIKYLIPYYRLDGSIKIVIYKQRNDKNIT